MSPNVKVPPAPTVYCPKEQTRVPIWYCVGSLTQGREVCSYLIRARIHEMKCAEVKCKWGGLSQDTT